MRKAQQAMHEQSALEAARDYLGRGWFPIPVPRGTKKPALNAWQQLRLTEAELQVHFPPHSNVGLLTGEASGGLVDVDLDCEEAVQLAGHFLPATRMRSGRENRPASHHWYSVTGPGPQYRAFKDVNDDKTMLVELRTDGHQTLVAPSVHPDGDRYAWDDGLEPAQVESDDLQRRVHELATASLVARHWPRAASSRHDIANAVAGMLARAGWPDDLVERFVREIARAAGDEEWRDRAQAAAFTARAVRQGKRVTGIPTLVTLLGKDVVDQAVSWLGLWKSQESAPWDPPAAFRAFELPEFPSEVLPPWMRSYVEALSVATQTPLALAGGLALGACAVGLAGRVRICIRAGWEEPTNLFIVIVLPPAERKTAVVAHCTAPICQHEIDECRRAEPEIREAEARRAILEARLTDATRKAAKAKLDERADREQEVLEIAEELSSLHVPVRPRLFADDITPERLAGLLYEHGGRFAIVSAEGGIFDMLAGRYSGNGAPNLDVFLKGHAGDPLRVDRVVRVAELVDQPALTVVLTVQTDVLRSLAAKPGFRGRGLLARFLYAVPASRMGQREIGAPPVPDPLCTDYVRKLRKLLATPCTTAPDGRESPWRLRLTADADRRLRDFERWIEPQLDRQGPLGSIADWAGKLAGAVARIAGILHVATHVDDRQPWARPVEASTIESAIVLARFYLEHAKAAFAEMGADPEIERALHILAWIRRHETTEFSERDAYKGCQGRFRKVTELRPGLQLLEEHNYIRKMTNEAPARAGRPPGPRYEVNPLAIEGFGDIGDSGERGQEFISTHPPSSNSHQDVSAASGENSAPPSQYPQNTQNPDGPPDDDEVEL